MNNSRLSHFSFNYAGSGHQRNAGGCEPVAGSVGAEEQRRDVFYAECECGRQQDSGPCGGDQCDFTGFHYPASLSCACAQTLKAAAVSATVKNFRFILLVILVIQINAFGGQCVL